MASLWTDITDYWARARRHYFNLVTGLVLAGVAFVSSITGLNVPAWVFWILAIVFLVVAQFRTYRDLRRDVKQVTDSADELTARQQRLSGTDDLANQECYLWELLPLVPKQTIKPLVTDRTFTKCTFRGPAMAGLLDSKLDHCTLGEGDMHTILLEVAIGPRQGLVGFLHCTFIRCRFIQIGFMGTKDWLAKVRADAVAV